MDSKTIFASMKDKNYDYQAQGIRFLTAFDELVNTETEQLDGYMILACNGGKMELDVNGTRTHLNIWVSPNYLTKVCKEISAKNSYDVDTRIYRTRRVLLSFKFRPKRERNLR